MQAGGFPLLGIDLGRAVFVDHVFDDFGAHVSNVFGNVLGLHQIAALFIDDLTLVIHDIVKFQNVLTNVEVACLDLLLGFLKRLVDPRMVNCFTFLQTQFLQHAVHAL